MSGAQVVNSSRVVPWGSVSYCSVNLGGVGAQMESCPESVGLGASREVTGEPLYLVGTCQNYAWGKLGSDSLVARLGANQPREDVPYAELWIGSHPKGPALLEHPTEGCCVKLDAMLNAHPQQLLGNRVVGTFGPDLPFLFKVLSIGGPLSIQAHPDKSLGELLHRRDPGNYPDSNHKPEIAVAVTELKMLYGLRSPADANTVVHSIFPELRQIVGDRPLNTDESVRDAFREILKASENDREVVIGQILNRVVGEQSRRTLYPVEQNLLDVTRSYEPGDPGVAASLLMNLVTVNPGEAIYTDPFVPHAYLAGDIVEVMATSDNVVRVGLTPKYRDQDTLLNKMLPHVTPGDASIITPVQEGSTLRYITPAAEFEVQRITASGNFDTSDAPELLFCLEGDVQVTGVQKTERLKAGGAVLIPAAAESFSVHLENGAQLYRVVIP